MRYKIYLSFLWGCLFCFTSYGQAPNWQVNANNYIYNMSLIATGDSSCFSSSSTDDIIGVFDAEGICRGKANLISFSSGYRVVMAVYGNELMETLIYKVYDASLDKVLISTGSMLAFEPETILGSISTPEIITICEEEIIEECIPKVELTDPISATINYDVGDTIISTSVISGSSTVVTFNAGTAIILNPGFEVKPTSIFTAAIEECIPNGALHNEASTERRQGAESAFNAIAGLQAKKLKIQLHPNPASVSMDLKYYLKQAGSAVFYISDNSGKLIQQISRPQAPIGWNTYKLDTELLEMGCYFLTIRTQSEMVTEKMIIIK